MHTRVHCLAVACNVLLTKVICIQYNRTYPPYVNGGPLIMRTSSPYVGLSAQSTSTTTSSLTPSPTSHRESTGGLLGFQSGFPLHLTDTFKLNRNFQSRVQKIVLEEPLALEQFHELMVRWLL